MGFERGDIIEQAAYLCMRPRARVLYTPRKHSEVRYDEIVHIEEREHALVLGASLIDSGILWPEYVLLWRGGVWTMAENDAHKSWKLLDRK